MSAHGDVPHPGLANFIRSRLITANHMKALIAAPEPDKVANADFVSIGSPDLMSSDEIIQWAVKVLDTGAEAPVSV